MSLKSQEKESTVSHLQSPEWPWGDWVPLATHPVKIRPFNKSTSRNRLGFWGFLPGNRSLCLFIMLKRNWQGTCGLGSRFSAYSQFLFNWGFPVQGDSLVSSVSLYQSVPLLSDWKSGIWGLLLPITGLLPDFCIQPSAFLGLRERPLTLLHTLQPLLMSVQNASGLIPSNTKIGSWVESEDGFLSSWIF